MSSVSVDYDESMNGYFRHPFPSRKAFGAYASPGPVVHLPAMFLMIGISWLLSNASWPVTLPTMGLAIFCAVYLGRDLAIKAHYNVLITLTVFVFLLGCLSVGVRPLQQLHHWAIDRAWGWPGWVYATSLLILVIRQSRRHRQIS